MLPVPNTLQKTQTGGDSDDNDSTISDEIEQIEQTEEVYDEIEDNDNTEEDENVTESDDDDDDDDNDDNDDGADDVEEEQVDDDDCLYRFTKKKKEIDTEEIDFDEDIFFDDELNIKKNEKTVVPDAERITKPVLTKFEKVRIIGVRARQLSHGAKPMIKGLTNMDPKEVAKLELKMKVIPLILIRTLPTGERERWKISELTIMN